MASVFSDVLFKCRAHRIDPNQRDSQCKASETGTNLVRSRDRKKGPRGQGWGWGVEGEVREGRTAPWEASRALSKE